MQRKVLQLPYLRGIKLDTLSKAEIGLLIGVNVPELFCISEFRKADNAAYQLNECLWKSDFLKGTTVLETPNSKEDRAVLRLMRDSITIQKEHYQLPLFWRHTEVSLSNNYVIAKHRLATVKRRFLNDPHLRAKYIDVINGYLEKGYARKLTNQELSVDVTNRLAIIEQCSDPDNWHYSPSKLNLANLIEAYRVHLRSN